MVVLGEVGLERPKLVPERFDHYDTVCFPVCLCPLEVSFAAPNGLDRTRTGMSLFVGVPYSKTDPYIVSFPCCVGMRGWFPLL